LSSRREEEADEKKKSQKSFFKLNWAMCQGLDLFVLFQPPAPLLTNQ
jgi:hypothetical protein